MDCTQIENHCLACNNQGRWKGFNNAKFPQDPTQYKQPLQQDIGGIANSKNFRTYASSFTILKKALTTTQPIPNNLPLNQWATSGMGVTNAGGPGDQVVSVPIITHSASGNKARLIVQPHQTGVDVKHNSYERYLARKRGINMRCPNQNC